MASAVARPAVHAKPRRPELRLFLPTEAPAPPKPRPKALPSALRLPTLVREHRLKLLAALFAAAAVHLLVLLGLRRSSPQLLLTWSRGGLLPSSAPDSLAAVLRNVRLDACRLSDAGILPPDAAFSWRFSDDADAILERLESTDCGFLWKAPREGDFRLSVVVSVAGELRYEAATLISVRDLWVVVAGDSFASGQGSPGEAAPQWLDEECKRSTAAWPFLFYQRLEAAYPGYGVHLSFLACAGASIRDGLLPPAENRGGRPSQLELVEQMSAAASTRPDLLLLSVGGNDIGISELLFALLWGTSERLRAGVQGRIDALRADFGRLADFVGGRLGLPPSRLALLEYYDIAENERGEADASCRGLFSASDADLRFASAQILSPLNRQLGAEAAAQGWTFVGGVQAAFRRHGYCSSDSFIVSVEESYRRQGSYFGAFHPNKAGHAAVAERVWDASARARLLP